MKLQDHLLTSGSSKCTVANYYDVLHCDEIKVVFCTKHNSLTLYILTMVT